MHSGKYLWKVFSFYSVLAKRELWKHYIVLEQLDLKQQDLMADSKGQTGGTWPLLERKHVTKPWSAALGMWTEEEGGRGAEDKTDYPKQRAISASQFLRSPCVQWEWEQCLLHGTRVGAEMRPSLKQSPLGTVQCFTRFSSSCWITVKWSQLF